MFIVLLQLKWPQGLLMCSMSSLLQIQLIPPPLFSHHYKRFIDYVNKSLKNCPTLRDFSSTPYDYL